MANTGQSCDAPTRLLVEKSCYDEVVDLAKKSMELMAEKVMPKINDNIKIAAE